MKNASKKNYRFSHTPASSKGLGDYYGTGVRAKLGKIRSSTVGFIPLTSKQMKTPPKSLV